MAGKLIIFSFLHLGHQPAPTRDGKGRSGILFPYAG